MSQNTHPARSPDFLSRLHDGELSPAERAHFESHRAHCGECRRAAAEFEAALALYRSSRPSPASPDLAARILRRLQTGAPPRRSFGPGFGIDLRWAGAFAAAVVAAIIGSSIVAKHEAEERLARAAAGPVRVVVEPDVPRRAAEPSTAPAVSEPLGAKPAAAVSTPPAAKPGAPRQELDAESPAAAFRSKSSGPNRLEKRLSLPEPAAQAVADGRLRGNRERENPSSPAAGRVDRPREMVEEKKTQSPAVAAARPAETRQAPAVSAMRAQAAEGEGNTSAADTVTPRRRLRFEPLDGQVGAPRLLEGTASDLPDAPAGSAWILTVDAAGRVTDFQPAKTEAPQSKDKLRAESVRGFSALRFEPADRPRRLLLTIE